MILKEKKALVLKERLQYFKKVLGKMYKFLTDTLARTIANILQECKFFYLLPKDNIFGCYPRSKL